MTTKPVKKDVLKRPASRPVAEKAKKGLGAWPGPALLDSQQIILSEMAEHAGGCTLHDLLRQHLKDEPKGAEHTLAKRMLASGNLNTFDAFHAAMDMAGGAEDETMSNLADGLRSKMIEKIEADFETMGLVELHQIQTFGLLVHFHRCRDWGVKLLPTNAAASSETDDLTPVEESDPEREKLRQAWLQAAKKARHAKQKVRDAKEDAEKAQKFKIAAWRAYTLEEKTLAARAAAAQL